MMSVKLLLHLSIFTGDEVVRIATMSFKLLPSLVTLLPSCTNAREMMVFEKIRYMRKCANAREMMVFEIHER
jgi:hypothetical protein